MKVQEHVSLLVQEKKIDPQHQEAFLAMLQPSMTNEDIVCAYENFLTMQKLLELHSTVSEDYVSRGEVSRELLDQINALCPECKQKSRSLTDVVFLACEECSTPTKRAQFHTYTCSACLYSYSVRVSVLEQAEKKWCGLCNE